jgi:hypothetical protein
MTGVRQSVNPTNPLGTNVAIRGTANTRGPYTTSHVLYIGTTNGKILRLDNPRNAAPETFPQEITPFGLVGNVQDIAVNPNNDDEVIAVVSNYNTASIWWTTNGKSAVPQWTNVEGNLALPSIRSCAIVVKKDAANNPVTEYYVGTSVGLYSATSLSASTTWVREGGNVLNYAVVQSLSYRPTDNVLLVGTHGNGMYFTYLGTPNYTPNLNTAAPAPITNDQRFITVVYPTVAGPFVAYKTGGLTGVRKVLTLITNTAGQEVWRREMAYQPGRIATHTLPAGHYILTIISDDKRYRHVQKFIKQ